MTMNKIDKWKKLMVMSLLAMVMSFPVGCSKEPVPDDVLPESESAETETQKDFKSDSGKMSITATDLWTVDESLHDESELSLYNEEYQSYLIILTDEKKVFPGDTDLDEYGDLVSESTMEGLDEGNLSEVKTLQVNGLEGRTFQITGLVDGTSVTYKFMVLEDETEFYQVIMWSFSENIENNTEYYEKILNSYKVFK